MPAAYICGNGRGQVPGNKQKISYNLKIYCMSMTKKELIALVASKTMRTQKEVKEVLDTALGVIGDTLAVGGSVNLTDFGKFHTQLTAEREVKVPGSDKKVSVPAKRRIRFKAFEGITVYSQKTI